MSRILEEEENEDGWGRGVGSLSRGHMARPLLAVGTVCTKAHT